MQQAGKKNVFGDGGIFKDKMSNGNWEVLNEFEGLWNSFLKWIDKISKNTSLIFQKKKST